MSLLETDTSHQLSEWLTAKKYLSTILNKLYKFLKIFFWTNHIINLVVNKGLAESAYTGFSLMYVYLPKMSLTFM